MSSRVVSTSSRVLAAVAWATARSSTEASLRVRGSMGPVSRVTSAAKAGKSERDIMRQTRHRSVVTVRSYVRDAELIHDNAAPCLL